MKVVSRPTFQPCKKIVRYTHMSYTVKKVVILGASGTVGSLVGGLFAQKEIMTFFLSRTLKGAKAGRDKAIKQARSETVSRYIECGDYEHSLEGALHEADLIIESVSEDLTIKKEIYHLLERYRKAEAIIGTTTSSLPLTILANEQTQSFRRYFLSTHFYNPPGRMLACEIAGTNDTEPQVYNFVEKFLRDVLGRVVVPVKNRPGFAGNRIAFLVFSKITVLAQEYGVEMMDYLIGPYTGRSMPPLATLDLVGLDVHKAIIRSLQDNTGNDMHDLLLLPSYVDKMIESNLLGNKAGGGFYKKLESGKFAYIDPSTCEYTGAFHPHLHFVEKVKHFIHMGLYKEAFDAILASKGREVDVVTDILYTYITYAFSLIGEVTDVCYGISGIDNVMSSGFHWAPPSVIVSMLGGKESVLEALAVRNLSIPEALRRHDTSTQSSHDPGKYFVAY